MVTGSSVTMTFTERDGTILVSHWPKETEKLGSQFKVSQVEVQSCFVFRAPAPGGPRSSFLGLLAVPIPCEPVSEEVRHKYLCRSRGRREGRLEVLGVLPDTPDGPSLSKEPVSGRGSFCQRNALWARASEAPHGSEVPGPVQANYGCLRCAKEEPLPHG